MKRTILSALVVCLLSFAAVSPAVAEIFCVRPDGSTYGSGDGSDWSNALSGFPAAGSGLWGTGTGKIGAGDTVYVAAGTYTSSLSPGASGGGESSRIVIRRATVGEHGPSTGWSSGMDGTVDITGYAYINLSGVSYITIDGVTEYGIYTAAAAELDYEIFGISVLNNCQHILIEHVRTDGSNNQDKYRGFNLRDSSDVIIRHCWDSYVPNDGIYMENMDGLIIEYCEFGPTIQPIDYDWHGDLIESRSNNDIDFRYNDVNWDSDGIFLFEYNSNFRIYGNIFRGGGKAVRNKSDATWDNTNILIHNNVMYNSYQGLALTSYSTGAARNNVFYGNEHSPGFGSLTADHNYYYNTDIEPNTGPDPFVDASNLDFHLIAGTPAVDQGASLSSPFDVDADGVTRPQGSGWDMGPYEYVTGSNQAPVADAGPDQTVTDSDDSGAESVTLDGSGSSDSDGEISSYVWDEDGTQIATGVSPSVSFAVGSHTVTLTVTDDDSATDTDTVMITVNAYSGNAAPVADAGPDQTVTDSDESGAESVTLDGSGSSDSDGEISSYVWDEDGTQIATGVSPSVSFAVGTHAVDLTVTDDDSATDTDSVVITVNAADGGGGEVYTINGSTADQVVRSDGTAKWVGKEDLRVGGGVEGADGAAVLVFQLPTLDAGETIATAALEINLESIQHSPSGHVDLYGLGYRASASVQTSDFYQGAYGGDTTDAWALQDDFATLSTPTGIVATGATGDANLASYLADQYAAGAQGGDYVFLRLNPDVADVEDYWYWLFTSADGTVVPVLTIETNVAASNEAPVADAGPDQTVTDSDDSGDESVTLDGSGSSDSDGTITSYVWEENSTQIATGVSPSVAFAVGTHTVDLTVTDDDSATDTDTVVITVDEWSATSSTTWQSFSFAEQTGSFLFEFDVVPNNDAMDGATGLSNGGATWWDDMACIVRFSPAGVIDVRDGDVYDADATLNYSAGTTYHVEMTVNIAAHTYSVDVTPDGGATTALATDYAFRTAQASVTRLDQWSIVAVNEGESHTVSDVVVTEIVNTPPVADAGADQTVTDTDGDGSAAVALDGSGSSDPDGTITSYVWEEDSSQIATGATPNVTMDVSVHTVDLTVTDDDSATDSDSVVVTVVSRTVTSTTDLHDWPNSSFPSQTGTFTCEFDAVPNAAGIDATVGLAGGLADWWDDMACIVRFNTTNEIDVRNGGSYAADTTLTYSSGATYHVRMVVDIPNHTYSVYVTPDGGAEVALATGYAFRTEQASVTYLDTWTMNAAYSVGTHTVSNLTLTD
ncbi:MAG: PKD domain-containing protein [Planctomycetota bacterium]